MNTGIESIPHPDGEQNLHRFDADSIERAIDVLGDRWSFMVLREAFFGVRRYGELARNLGCSRTILTARLRRLVDAGVMRRRRYRTDPDRYEYVLTEVGAELYPSIILLMRWADEHLAGDAGPPLLLRHLPCGRDTRPKLVCSECGVPIHAQDVVPRPGPGAHA